MPIVVNLPPEFEALLRSRAAQQEQDIDFFTSELLVNLFKQEKQELEESLKAIQQRSRFLLSTCRAIAIHSLTLVISTMTVVLTMT